MSTWLFSGSARIEALPADSRGFAYGDGLFETMRVHAGRVFWWHAHWNRLADGARRLRIALPDPVFVQAQALALANGCDDGVLKLIVSRGAPGRGYAFADATQPVWALSRHLPPHEPRPGGLHLHLCETRLSIQPALAGIKHCNRLEQVLARAEWGEGPFDEGLMRDIDGYAVCATSANLFAYGNGRWRTPPVDRCGVAGICRGWAIDALGAEQARMTVDDLVCADALFLCNAVRGILPVARLRDRTWQPPPEVAAAIGLLARTHPAFDRETP